MSFDETRCYPRTFYCGKKEKQYPYTESETVYIRRGTPYECLQKGFGAGSYTEKKKNLREDSLQNIKYIGEKFESRFKSAGINSISQLLNFARTYDRSYIKQFLERILQDKSQRLNRNAYNSVLLFLYRRNISVSNIPFCIN